MYDDMGRGSNDMSYTWNEYGRPAIDLAFSVGGLVQTGKYVEMVIFDTNLVKQQTYDDTNRKYIIIINILLSIIK